MLTGGDQLEPIQRAVVIVRYMPHAAAEGVVLVTENIAVRDDVAVFRHRDAEEGQDQAQ